MSAREKKKIRQSLVEAFFPAAQIPPGYHRRICADPLRVSDILIAGGYQTSDRGTLTDLAGEKRYRLFSDTLTSLESNFDYWLQGMDNDVLDEFPAQKLIAVANSPEAVLWRKHWLAAGGKLIKGEMVALKWDQVWFRISAFNLPFPPFQLGSFYETEDVDRTAAKHYGLSVPERFNASVTIAFDVADLRRRFESALERHITTANLPPIIQ